MGASAGLANGQLGRRDPASSGSRDRAGRPGGGCGGVLAPYVWRAMIRYALTCAEGHSFESWFASASAFDDLRGRGLVACVACGSGEVEKALMAPAVRPTPRSEPRAEAPGSKPPPRDPREEALARLRAKVEAESEYVGLSFAAEARAMHEGDVPHRSIYGEARPDEARALLEDGVPVAPLPFVPKRSAN